MALTGTDRGTGNNGTTGLTLAVVPASNLTAGAMAVLVVSADNTGASGIYSITTATDTKNNVWTRQQSPLYDPGLAAAGVQGAIFTTRQTGGTLTTGDTITVTFSVTTVAKAWTLMEVTAAGGSFPAYVEGGVNAGAATAAPTVTTVSITSGDMVIGGLFNEYGTAQTVTGDGDSTNGSWSAQQTNEVGTTAAGISVSSQRKVVTATATQTFNPTLGTSSDVILAYIVIRELTVTTCYRNAVIADSPAAYWRLSETAGAFLDIVGGYNGAVGGAPTRGAAGMLANDPDLALDCNSLGTCLVNPFTLNHGNTFTIECWVKWRTGVVAILWGRGSDGPEFRTNSNGTFRLDRGNGVTIATSTAVLVNNVAAHVVVTKSGATTKIYKDGVEGTTAGTDSTLLDSEMFDDIGIGSDRNSAIYFNVAVDEVAFYTTALTPIQVATHYAAATVSCPPLPYRNPMPPLIAQ